MHIKNFSNFRSEFHALKFKTMRPYITLTLILLIGGCGKPQQTSQNQEQTQQATTQKTAEQPPAIKYPEFPEGYRHWTHIKSMVILKGHPLYNQFGGIHHVYANDIALEGYKTGKFPDGSVIAIDFFEEKLDNNAYVEGKRKFVGVMYKDSKQFTETGGWGFEAFKGDTKERLVKDQKNDCFACHASQKETDFVFSKDRG